MFTGQRRLSVRKAQQVACKAAPALPATCSGCVPLSEQFVCAEHTPELRAIFAPRTQFCAQLTATSMASRIEDRDSRLSGLQVRRPERASEQASEQTKNIRRNRILVAALLACLLFASPSSLSLSFLRTASSFPSP